MRKNLTSIKNDLWTYRKKMGLSQKRAAYFMGLKGTNSLSRYEHRVKLPNLINALKLEIVYRTPVAFLFRELYEMLKKDIRKREENLRSKEENKENNNDSASI
jgi:transcriptional regulator with XRE-family HTH domain